MDGHGCIAKLYKQKSVPNSSVKPKVGELESSSRRWGSGLSANLWKVQESCTGESWLQGPVAVAGPRIVTEMLKCSWLLVNSKLLALKADCNAMFAFGNNFNRQLEQNKWYLFCICTGTIGYKYVCSNNFQNYFFTCTWSWW